MSPHLDWCIPGVKRYKLITRLLLLLLTSGESCQSCQKQRTVDETAKALKALKAVKRWEKLVKLITVLKPSMLGLVLPLVIFSLTGLLMKKIQNDIAQFAISGHQQWAGLGGRYHSMKSAERVFRDQAIAGRSLYSLTRLFSYLDFFSGFFCIGTFF